MAIRYRNTFYSQAGVLWQVDISDTAYTGAVSLFKTESSGFNLSYKGLSERLDPIFASTLSLSALVDSTSIESLIYSMMVSQEEQFTVKVYKNSVLYWCGVHLPDQIQKEDIYFPYIVDIMFTDGLARLRDIDYNSGGIAPVAYSGRETVLAHILKILEKTGISALYGSGAGDVYLHTIINWYEITHQYNYYKCPFAYTDINHGVFLEYDDAGVVTYMKCSEVLEMILRTFNARILMVDGCWHIIQPQEYARLKTYERCFNKLGTLWTSYNESTFRITPLVTNRKTGGVHKYFPPVKRVQKTYKTKTSSNSTGSILPIQTSYLTPVSLITTIPASTKLFIYGNIREQFALDDPYLPAVSLYTKWKLSIVLTDVISGNHLYLTNKNSWFEWSSTITDTVLINSPSKWGTGWDFTWPLSVTTPVIAGEFYATFQLTKYNQYYTNGLLYTLGANFYLAEYYDFTVIPDLSGLVEDGDDIVYSAVNTLLTNVVVSSSVELNLPDTLIGDGPTGSFMGKLMAYNGTTWVNTSLWSIHNSTNRFKIHQLSVIENLKGQRIAVEKYTGTYIDNSITALSSLRWNERIFVPMIITINPAMDEITGEWFNVIIPPL